MDGWMDDRSDRSSLAPDLPQKGAHLFITENERVLAMRREREKPPMHSNPPSDNRSFFGRLFSGPWTITSDTLLAKGYALSTKEIPRINDLLGLSYSGQPRFLVVERGMEAPATTSGDVITLNLRWFQEHPDDDGCIVHELVHVVMHCPRMDNSNSWMIEGIADYVRDKLGYTMPWSRPVRGDPRSGYQATAHFLLFVERRFGIDNVRRIAVMLSESGDLPDDIDSEVLLYLNS
jgi:hypothetical protein